MPSFGRTLSVQSPLMRGPDVLAAQRALRSLGSLDVEIDGLFGPMTAQAVRAFRQKRSLPDSETVDEATWTALMSAPAAGPVSDLAAIVRQLGTPHQFRDSVTWHLGQNGIAVGAAAAVGTPGEPLTVRRIMKDFGTAIADSCNRHRIPVDLVVATIATESRGEPDAKREEPGFESDEATPGLVSIGLMQTLISTAREAMGKPDIDRAWLFVPANSIEAGTAFIAKQVSVTGYDPPKVACAYNAGGLYYDASPANRWRMRQYPLGTSEHADRFIAFFNDTLFSLRNDPSLVQGPSFASHFVASAAETAFATSTAAAAPTAGAAVPVLDPLIEKLNLRATARLAAYALKRDHPQVVFTSGRRNKADQARAMSQNVVSNRSWIAETYAANKASKAAQDWVTSHPEAVTATAIEAGLLSVFNSLTDTELGQLSRHLSGDAFDVQPVEPDTANIKDTIRSLAGLRNFFDREGGLVRWHAEFNA